MTVEEIVSKINELRAVLDKVAFELYFNPKNSVNVVGFDSMDERIIEVQLGCNALAAE